MEKKEIAIIFNPAAARGKSAGKKKRLETHLQAANIPYRLFETQSETHLIETAAALVHDYPIIIGAGGDTTVTLIAREILRAGTGNTLGVIALGSVNDLAREIGVLRLTQACQAIKERHTVTFDVGAVKSARQEEPFIFLSQVSIGLGVEINRYVSTWMDRHKLISHLYNIAQTLAAIGGFYHSFKHNTVPVDVDLKHAGNGNSRPFHTPFLIFTNTSILAREFRLSPNISPIDGKLDCCILNAGDLPRFLNALYHIKRRTHLENNKMEIIQDQSFKIYSGAPLEMQADGEIFQTEGEVEIFTIPRAIEMIVHPAFKTGAPVPGAQ